MSKISRDMVILVSCLIVMVICIHIAYGISNDVLRASYTRINPACKFATDFVIVFLAPSKYEKK